MNYDVDRLNKLLYDLKSELGEGLISTTIWDKKDGVLIAGENLNPSVALVFNKITELLQKTLKSSGLPNLKDYYMIKLENELYLVIIISQHLYQSLLVDTKKIAIGMITSIAIPKALEALTQSQS